MSAPPTIAPLVAAVDVLASVAVHGLGDGALLESVEELHRLRSRLAAIESDLLRVAEAREVTVAECGRATRSWLIEELCVGPAEASRRMRLARELPSAPGVEAALRSGDISPRSRAHDPEGAAAGATRRARRGRG